MNVARSISKVTGVNGHTKFKEVTVNRIRDRWLSHAPSAKGNNHIYIHGPFCAQLCSFCMHQGTELKGEKPAVENYYGQYLPDHLAEFENVLESTAIRSIYFGGGTADLMGAKFMPAIFSSIPNFDKIRCKIFEAHPATLNKAQIDQLGIADFSGGYISFGLQTFDREVCRRENRIYTGPERLLEKVEYLRAANISVNVDLVAFINKCEVEGLTLLAEDLQILATVVNPQIVTIYPLRQAFNYKNQLSEIEKPKGDELCRHERKKLELANGLQNTVAKFLANNRDYSLWTSKEDREVASLKDCMKPIYLTTLTVQEIDRFRGYNSSSPPFHNPEHSVIGFGNYQRIYSHSYIKDELAYYTMNDEWSTRYFVVHDDKDPNYDLNILGWDEVETL